MDAMEPAMTTAERCAHSGSLPWKGHTAALRHTHCGRMTRHPSGYCWQHLPYEDWIIRRDEREARRAATSPIKGDQGDRHG